MRIAVLGNGGFGTAMALALDRAGHHVGLWGHDAVYTAHVAASRRNPRYLEGVVLPDSIRVSNDGAAVLDRAEIVLVAVPTQHVRTVATTLRPFLPPEVPLVSLAKGLDGPPSMRTGCPGPDRNPR